MAVARVCSAAEYTDRMTAEDGIAADRPTFRSPLVPVMPESSISKNPNALRHVAK